MVTTRNGSLCSLPCLAQANWVCVHRMMLRGDMNEMKGSVRPSAVEGSDWQIVPEMTEGLHHLAI